VKWTKTYALAAILRGNTGMLCHARGRQEGKFTGTIIDFDGNPWANLPVKIKSDQGVTTESKTDAAGKFSFTGLKNGKYTFTVQPPKCRHVRCPFECTARILLRSTELQGNLEKQNPKRPPSIKNNRKSRRNLQG